MLSKEEKKAINQEFWSDFKTYMRPHQSSNGRRVNWLNYPTDIKCIYLRLEADKFGARINFDIQPKDKGIREIIWEQMEELKKVMTDSMNGDVGNWNFEYSTKDVDSFSRISWELEGVNYYVLADREKIFTFFKEKLIPLDTFYQNFKDILILLVK